MDGDYPHEEHTWQPGPVVQWSQYGYTGVPGDVPQWQNGDLLALVCACGAVKLVVLEQLRAEAQR